jgi:hypothetical protein
VTTRPLFPLAVVVIALCISASAQTNTLPAKPMNIITHLQNFQVIEFRRYTIKPGGREQFAKYFESYFPEAFQQLGAIAFGDFLERKQTDHFTWLRGFHDMDGRATANSAFYYGPLWKEHKATLNNLIVDSDNVLLLRPIDPSRGVAVLPAVDPVLEPAGAKGIVVAQIFAVKPGSVDGFAAEAEATFAKYRNAGAREAGVLVTLDAPNNFPQLPVRTDGPYLVWLGILKDNAALDQLMPLMEASQSSTATSLLRGTPEIIVLDPGPRSRLRWQTEWIRR